MRDQDADCVAKPCCTSRCCNSMGSRAFCDTRTGGDAHWVCTGLHPRDERTKPGEAPQDAPHDVLGRRDAVGGTPSLRQEPSETDAGTSTLVGNAPLSVQNRTNLPDTLGRRVPHDPPPRPRRGHRDENRLPQLPRHRHHGVFAERGQTRSGAADGQPRIRPHHRALRQTQRPGLARRGREDPDLKSNHWWPRQHFPPAVVGALLDFKEQLDRTGARVGGCASCLSFQCRRPNVVSQEAVMYT